MSARKKLHNRIQGLIPVLVMAAILLASILTAGCIQTAQQNIPATQPPSPAVTPASGSVAVSTAPIQPGVTTGSPVIVMQPHGVADPAFIVDVIIPEKIAPGTTLVGDLHDLARPRIVEVNMLGEIVWEYNIPNELKDYTNPGFSAVPLENGNILAAFPRNGVYEINRTTKAIVWKFIDPKASHDAERLANGNTLVVDGGYGRDTMEDAQVREINPQGEVVWSWYAKDEFNRAPYNVITNNEWTHTNAASRLENGNTLVSLRNFNLVAEVDRNGKLVRILGEGVMRQQHDPEELPNGNLLFANPGRPPQAIEINSSGTIVWSYLILQDIPFASASTRDADRLQNGNTLITAANRLIEVTPQGDIVWQFRLNNLQFASEEDAKARGFYKAIRIPA